MAIATYSDLQAAIANYLARPGDSLVSTPAPDFVTLAESRIAYGGDVPLPSNPLRIRPMETTAMLITGAAQAGGISTGSPNVQTVTLATVPTLALGLTIGFTAAYSNTGAATLDAGTGAVTIKKGVPQADVAAGDIVAGGGYVAYHDGTYFNLVPSGAVPLPAGFLEMRSIFIQGSPARQLTPVTPEIYNSSYLAVGTCKPDAYCLEGDCIRFGPAPDSAYAVQMGYYQKFPALSGSQATNWLLTNKPDVYLYGSLLEAAIYFGQEDDQQRFYALFKSAIDGLQAANTRDRYSGAALQLRSGVMGA
jgi:hypothetical protein